MLNLKFITKYQGLHFVSLPLFKVYIYFSISHIDSPLSLFLLFVYTMIYLFKISMFSPISSLIYIL